MPERLESSGWVEHVPFAMWLISVMQPRVLVELGTYHGTSYCGFCQAIAALGLPTRAFAVDTWQGDPHSGSLAPESLANLRKYHDPRYGTFSTLLQMTFDEAATRFADGEIDLLHIDGYHTYEAVRHDFETWRSKLSLGGVVLFHDVAEKKHDFGVWRLWDDMKSLHPSFIFEHEHGLGVLAIGTALPDEVQRLVALRGDEADSVREFFKLLGSRIRLKMQLDSCQSERDAYLDSLQEAKAEWPAVESMIAGLHEELNREREKTVVMEREIERLTSAVERLQSVEQEYQQLQHAAERLQSVEQEYQQLQHAAAQMRCELITHHKHMVELQASASWRLTHRLAGLAKMIAPPGTRRRRVLTQAVWRHRAATGQELARSIGR